MKLYERCANEIAELIRTGILRAGDRLPSVRATSAARGISRSTVFEVYYLLETRGLIEARSRSCYYVRTGLAPTKLQAPADSRSDRRARNVDIGQLVFELLGPMARREFAPLGSAFLSPSLCPLTRLARHLWTEMRDLDPWRLIEDLATGNEALRRQIGLRYAMDGVVIAPT